MKLHGGPWDGRIIERRWSGTPEMQLALVEATDPGLRTLPSDDDALPPIPMSAEAHRQFARKFALHTYVLGDHDADGLWHYHYDSAKPGHVRGPMIEDTGR